MRTTSSKSRKTIPAKLKYQNLKMLLMLYQEGTIIRLSKAVSYSANGELYRTGNKVLPNLNPTYNKITLVGVQVIWKTDQKENLSKTNGISRIIFERNISPNCLCNMNAIYGLTVQKTGKQSYNIGSEYESFTFSLLKVKRAQCQVEDNNYFSVHTFLN